MSSSGPKALDQKAENGAPKASVTTKKTLVKKKDIENEEQPQKERTER